MTDEDFRRLQEPLLDCLNRRSVPIAERQAAHLALIDLWRLRAEHERLNQEEKPELKPRKKLTAVEKFDKKNSRREAIMAQRERRG